MRLHNLRTATTLASTTSRVREAYRRSSPGTDVTHRALRVACAARTVANGGGVSNGQGSQGRARGARVPWRLAGGARHAASGGAVAGVDAQATG